MNSVASFVAVGGVIAAVGGVIATVWGVGKAVKSVDRQLQLQFFADYTKRYQEIMLQFPESINDDDFQLESLDPDRRDRTLRYMRAYFDLCSEEYYLSKHEHIDGEAWKEWESGIKYALSKTAFEQSWERVKLNTTYYPEFVEFVALFLKK